MKHLSLAVCIILQLFSVCSSVKSLSPFSHGLQLAWSYCSCNSTCSITRSLVTSLGPSAGHITYRALSVTVREHNTNISSMLRYRRPMRECVCRPAASTTCPRCMTATTSTSPPRHGSWPPPTSTRYPFLPLTLKMIICVNAGKHIYTTYNADKCVHVKQRDWRIPGVLLSQSFVLLSLTCKPC